MTVPVSTRKSGPYDCDGGETSFAYGFRAMAAADLAVWRRRGGDETQLTLGVDYSVTGVGNSSGGSVILSSAALDGDSYLILGFRAHARLTDISTGAALYPAVLNPEFDSLQTQLRELRRDLDGAVRRSPFDTAGATVTLPPVEPGKVIGADDDGNLTWVEPGSGTGGGEPIPDPLPVDKGGTGGNTGSEARANIGAIASGDVPALIAADLAANAATRRGNLSLAALATRNTVATAHIDAKAVTLAKMADGPLGRYLGYDPVTGVITDLPPVDAVKVTALGRHTGGAGGLVRHWVVQGSEVYACGDGANRQNGMLADTAVPIRMAFNVTPGAISKLRAGGGSVFVVDGNGRVYSAGRNNAGQLGHGDTTARAVLTRIEYFVSNGITIADVFPASEAGGTHCFTYFLSTTGAVYAVGDNTRGQLGQGDTTAITAPAAVSGLTSIAGIAVSGNENPHALAWRAAGQLYACGYNHVGQLGDGTTTQRETFVAIGAVTDCAEALASGYASVVRRSGGTVATTGYNNRGHLGQGDTTNRSAFTTVSGVTGAAQIAMCGSTVGVRMTDKTVKLWGGNASGQLGNASTTDATSPVTPSGTLQGRTLDLQLAGGDTGMAAYARCDNGQIYAAGSGLTGGVGTGSTAATNTAFAALVGLNGTVTDMAACGADAAVGLSILYDDGRTGVCGNNANGELGLGTAGAHAAQVVDSHLLNRGGPAGNVDAAMTAALADAQDYRDEAEGFRDEAQTAATGIADPRQVLGFSISSPTLTINAGSVTPYVYAGLTPTSGQVIEIVYRYKSTDLPIAISATTNTSLAHSVLFDTASLTATVVSGASAATITDIGGGWVEAIVTKTAAATSLSNVSLYPRPAGSTSIAGFTASGTETAHVRSFQMRVAGTTTNLLASDDITDAGTFTTVACVATDEDTPEDRSWPDLIERVDALEAKAVGAEDWTGAEFAALGTSITQEYYYVDQVASKLSATALNYGFSGGTWSGATREVTARVAAVDPRVPLVTIEGPINDFRLDRTLGSTRDTNGAASVTGAMYEQIADLLEANPYRRIAYILSPGNDDETYAGEWNDDNGNGVHWDEVEEAVRRQARWLDIPVIEPPGFQGITSKWLTSDLIHPTEVGAQMITAPVAGTLATLKRPAITQVETPVVAYDLSTGNVTITCATSGSAIQYTTDGSNPTTASTTYSGAFTVSDGEKEIRAIATKSGLGRSPQRRARITQNVTGPGTGTWDLRPAVVGDISATGATIVGLETSTNYSVQTRQTFDTYAALWLATGSLNAVEFEVASGSNMWLCLAEGASGWYGIGNVASGSVATGGRFALADGSITVGSAPPTTYTSGDQRLGKRYRIGRIGDIVQIYYAQVGGSWTTMTSSLDLSALSGIAGYYANNKLGVLLGLTNNVRVKNVRVGTLA